MRYIAGCLGGMLIFPFSFLFVLMPLLSVVALIVSGVWLGRLGEWQPILSGIGIMFISIFIILSIVIPTTAIFLMAISLRGRENMLARFAGHVLGIVGVVYLHVVLVVYCVSTLHFFAKQTDSSAIVPALIWSYGVATFYLTAVYFQESKYRPVLEIPVPYMHLAYMLSIPVVLFFDTDPIYTIFIFGGSMFLSLITLWSKAVSGAYA